MMAEAGTIANKLQPSPKVRSPMTAIARQRSALNSMIITRSTR